MVQDQVEEGLKKEHYEDVAGAYHSYRMMHQEMRKRRSALEKEVESKLMASDVQYHVGYGKKESYGESDLYA